LLVVTVTLIFWGYAYILQFAQLVYENIKPQRFKDYNLELLGSPDATGHVTYGRLDTKNAVLICGEL